MTARCWCVRCPSDLRRGGRRPPLWRSWRRSCCSTPPTRPPLRDELLQTVACKSAIKAGMHTDPAELQALVDKVQCGADALLPPRAACGGGDDEVSDRKNVQAGLTAGSFPPCHRQPSSTYTRYAVVGLPSAGRKISPPWRDAFPACHRQPSSTYTRYAVENRP